jgi:hypothetical protein
MAFFSSMRVHPKLGITNLKGPMILFYIAGVLLLHVFFTVKLTTERLRVNFFIEGILL